MKQLDFESHSTLQQLEMWKGLYITRGMVSHTRESRRGLERVLGTDDADVKQMLDDDSSLKWTAHRQVLAQTLAVVRMTKSETVADIGCGTGMLVSGLSKIKIKRGGYKGTERVVGVDIDQERVGIARHVIDSRARSHDAATDVIVADVEQLDDEQTAMLTGMNAVVSTEVIEHLPEDRYQAWADSIMELGAGVVVMTTPNREYNDLLRQDWLTAEGLRIEDHKFEFTRSDFQDWASDTAGAHSDYQASVLGIGQAHLDLGPPSLMAVFQTQDS